MFTEERANRKLLLILCMVLQLPAKDTHWELYVSETYLESPACLPPTDSRLFFLKSGICFTESKSSEKWELM